MHIKEVIAKYWSEEAIFSDAEKALLISVNREAALRSLYDAVRYAWVISIERAKQADVVLATKQGLIVGAFIAYEWLPATAENFPGRWNDGDNSGGRFGFVGEEAPPEVWQRYVGKRVPDKFRKRGASNPIKYAW
jgi:uncharacterized protein